jgi:hypothetical protein
MRTEPTLRRWLAAATLVAGLGTLVSAAPDPAGDALPPPPPRAQRPTGRVLFHDDFQDPDLTGWTRDRDGVWSVRHGMLRAELPDVRQQHAFLYAGSEDWTDYAVDLDVCMMRGVDKGVAVRVVGEDGIGIDLRGPGYQDVVVQHREWPMGRARVANGNAVWHHLRVEVSGNRFRVSVDGEFALEAVDKRGRRPNGRIALSAYTGGVGECLVYYDHVVVTALDDGVASGQ